MILDGGGENVYEFDYLAHGGGYWCGLGFARDFGGNTKRLITPHGLQRRTAAVSRSSSVSAAAGDATTPWASCFDDSGDDVYEGTIMGTGMAWDCSMGVLCDFGGNDHYIATGGLDPGDRRPDGLRHPLRLRRRRRLRRLRPGLRHPGHFLSPLARLRRQLQLPRSTTAATTPTAAAPRTTLHPTRSCGGFLIDRPRQEDRPHGNYGKAATGRIVRVRGVPRSYTANPNVRFEIITEVLFS